MENDYQTPMKSQGGAGDGASTIAHGLTDTRGMAESKLQHHDGQSNDRAEDDKRLDQIESQIQEIGEQLRKLHLQIERQPDIYSENLLSKERYRSDLKKRIIDLDYEHKQIIAKRIQQERRLKDEKADQWRKQVEQREQQRRQQRQQRQEQLSQEREEPEQRRKEQLDKYEQQYRERLRGLTSSRKQEESRVQDKPSEETNQQGSQQLGQQSSELKPEGSQLTSQIVEDELARSRRRLRIAQIEAELAESRLRRSRITTLSTELEALRVSYLDPYYVYRPSLLPSYYYPYSAYPVYNRWWYY